MDGVGIDTGARDFAEYADIEGRVGGDEHADLRVEEHSLFDECALDGLRSRVGC